MSKSLELELSSLVIHQDDYYHSDEYIFSRGLSWDHTLAIKWDEIRETINASGSENVIFEGTMVADELIGMGKDARFLDERWEVKPIWLDVDKETAKSRRTSRTDYEVADPPGYFDEKVWPLCCVKKKMAQEKRILLLHQHEKVNLKKVIHDFFN